MIVPAVLAVFGGRAMEYMDRGNMGLFRSDGGSRLPRLLGWADLDRGNIGLECILSLRVEVEGRLLLNGLLQLRLLNWTCGGAWWRRGFLDLTRRTLFTRRA